jgi:DNA-binding MarR family transcriptional regulator
MRTEARTADRAPSAEELPGRLRLAVGRLARLLGRHAAAELTLSQWSALSTIARSGPLRIGELGELERVSVPTLSRLVADLEALGLVERRTDPADARAHRLTVTAAGLQWLSRAKAGYTAALADQLGCLSADQRATLAASVPVLELLVDRLSRPRAPDHDPRPRAPDHDPRPHVHDDDPRPHVPHHDL